MAGTGAITGGAIAGTLAGSRPNFILVMTDDQGMEDLSCIGNPILKTPDPDCFYEQATRFTDFQFSPTCAPTRAAPMNRCVFNICWFSHLVDGAYMDLNTTGEVLGFYRMTAGLKR